MKKKRVETFRYPVGRTIYIYIIHIYIYTYRQRAQLVRLGGLAPARPTITRKMHTSGARLPKMLTFEPGDYVLKSSRRNI